MRLILNIAFLLVNIALFAQTPGIPYQAVLLSQDDPQELPGYDSEYSNVLRNSLESIQFSIQDINGLEFKEYHSDVIVDDYGYDEISNIVEEDDVPYSQEYVSLLARQGKIDAYKDGKNWLTSKEAILNYMHKRKRKR